MEKQKKIKGSKYTLRMGAKHRRDSLSQPEIRQWSDKICEILKQHTYFQDAGTVYFYYPLGSEVNLLPLAMKALELGKQAAFPRVSGSDMEFYRVFDLERFTEGAFHVMEPACNAIMREEKALVFVPGLVFDDYGNRMGYGKGYYDRYLARYPGCHKIGVCYGMQMVPKVPCGEYDIPMDSVVTEHGITNITIYDLSEL